MPIPKYDVLLNRKTGEWQLKKAGANRAKRVSDTKKEALKNLSDAVGPNGGSVRIRRKDNAIQEERTYPRSKDPKHRPG